MTDYDYRNCQSLFGCAAKVHERSGGVCQLCGAGAAGLDFDLWRQMTVEHLIGESQGGYLSQILASLAGRFPGLSAAECAELAAQIDAANTVTACSFCNATTSRAQAPASMTILIETAPDGTPEEIRCHVTAGLDGILAVKQKDVAWKLASVRRAFDSGVAPHLADAWALRPPGPPTTAAAPDVQILVERITSDVAATPDEFVTPPGYAHLSLALVDAIYSIRSRYPAVKRVITAYCAASGADCQPLAARSSPAAPYPGGRAPAWVNAALPPRPQGQLPVPSIADLASLAMRRLWERLEAGEASVSPQDAAALIRLAREIERDDAVAAAAEARARAEMFQKGMASTLWTAKRHIDPARWRAFMDDLRRECEPFAPRPTLSPGRR